jgi:hypothetical protein
MSYQEIVADRVSSMKMIDETFRLMKANVLTLTDDPQYMKCFEFFRKNFRECLEHQVIYCAPMKVQPKHFLRSLFAPKGYNTDMHNSFETYFLKIYAMAIGS